MTRFIDRLPELAGTHGLSAYDAVSLDLAPRLGLGLATLDERLADAARAEKIEVFSG